MKPGQLNRYIIVVAGILLAGFGPLNAGAEQYSGFIDDYSGLEKVKDPDGHPLMRFVNPRLTPENYHALIVEPVQLFPEPKATDKVSLETLEQIKQYLNDKLQAEFARLVEVTDQPGPGVARIRVAVTGVNAKAESLKPYQYIPVALVLTTAKRAVTGVPEDAKLFVESEAVDSVSGERLFIGIRSGTGEKLKDSVDGTKMVTLDSLKPLIDGWTRTITRTAPTYIKARN